MKIVPALILFAFVLLQQSSVAQITTNKNALLLSVGSSFNGSGDDGGLYVGTSFNKSLQKRWDVSVGIFTTIHDDVNPIFIQFAAGEAPIDASVRYNTAGVQVQSIFSYRLIDKNKHTLKTGLGGFVRYQTTSSDSYSLLFPAATGLPFPVLYFNNREKQRIFSVGPIAQISYDYHLIKKIFLGLQGSFQLDTNGDNIANFGIRVGYPL